MAAYDCQKCGRFLCDCDAPDWSEGPRRQAQPCDSYVTGSDPDRCVCGWQRHEHAGGGHL